MRFSTQIALWVFVVMTTRVVSSPVAIAVARPSDTANSDIDTGMDLDMFGPAVAGALRNGPQPSTVLMGEAAGAAVRAPRIMIKCDKSDGPELRWGEMISDWFSGEHIDGANPIAPDWKVMEILPDTGVNCTRETGSRIAWTQHISGTPPRLTIPGQLQSCGPQYNWITPKDAAEYIRLLLGRCRRNGRAGGRIDVVPNEVRSVSAITLWWWNPELQSGGE